MPHDKNGKVLKVGDIVNIPCRIKNIQLGEEYCNISLETLTPMPPYTSPNELTLNTKQVELATPMAGQEGYYEDQHKG